jgi:hypothetical protein
VRQYAQNEHTTLLSGDALLAAGRAEKSSTGVLPGAHRAIEGVSSRFTSAAVAGWPTSPPPFHERFATALASPHEASQAARLTARRSEQARQSVSRLLRTSIRS